jgi:hypothetical protein
MTSARRPAEHTATAARTALATALDVLTSGRMPDPRAAADRLLADLYLTPAVRPVRSDRPAVAAALRDHLGDADVDADRFTDQLLAELHQDGYAVLPRTRPLLLLGTYR